MQAIMILAVSLWLVWPTAALAEVVGHLTQVEGRVEWLKGGKLPATAAKMQDGVEPGDVLRTKSLSRAQITFLDNTSLTLSPESRIAIEAYTFDAAKGKRSAVVQLFQGLAHFVVNQVFKVQEPDFLVKTHTGVLGVRGTDFGIRLSANDSTFLNFKGLVRVGNIFPEVGGAFKKAEKVAFAFGGATVDLKDMQGTVVARALPPTLPFTITAEDRQMFLRQVSNGLKDNSRGDSLWNGPSDLAADLPRAVNPAVANQVAAVLNTISIPPRLIAVDPKPSIETYTFSQTYSSGYLGFSAPLNKDPVFSGSLYVSRSVVYPGNNYLAVISGMTTNIPGSIMWPSYGGGSFNVTNNSITVSGLAGGTFSGTMQLTGTMVSSPTFGPTSVTFNLSGPVTIDPNGTLTFTPGGTLTATFSLGSVPITVQGNVTGGTWVQSTYTQQYTYLGANQAARHLVPVLAPGRPTLIGTRQLAQSRL